MGGSTSRNARDPSGNVTRRTIVAPAGRGTTEALAPACAPGASPRPTLPRHERDEETGLDYMLARYYAASMGRFLRVDPGFDAHPENPQSWDLYAYVRNNPATSVDPDGQYGGGAGVTDKQWKKFDRAEQNATKRAEKTVAKIDNALATGKGPKCLSKQFERTFGNGSAAASNMTQVSTPLKDMASVLRDNGSGGNSATGPSRLSYIGAGGSTNGMTCAPLGGEGVTVNLGHPSLSDARQLPKSALHESAHNVGLPHGTVNGTTAYRWGDASQQAAFEALPRADVPAALRNPDHLVVFSW